MSTKNGMTPEEARTVERWAISNEEMAQMCFSNQRDRSWSTKSASAFRQAARALRNALKVEVTA